MSKMHFDLMFLQRFWRIFGIIVPGFRSASTLLFVAVLCVSLLEQVIIYFVGVIPSKFYKVLGDKDKNEFSNIVMKATILIVSIAFIKSTSTYITSVMYLRWRRLLTKDLHSNYFKDIIYYKINVLNNSIDNPDQRITQDVDRLCSKLSQIIASVIISPFTIGYYVYQAWISTGYLGPVSVFAFFILMCIINKFLMSPVVQRFVYQEKYEGEFRYKHMLVRNHSEGVAFYKSGEYEEDKTNKKFYQLQNVQSSLITWQYFLNFSINGGDYLGSILSYLVLAGPIFLGKYDNLSASELSALISKNAFVCIYLISCFTKLIDLAAQFTDIAGTTHRIGQLYEEFDEYALFNQNEESKQYGEMNPPNFDRSDLTLLCEDGGFCNNAKPRDIELSDRSESSEEDNVVTAYKVESLTYGIPKNGDVLVKGLTFEINNGSNILITGDSGCGKSSLLRILRGLWSASSGSINLQVPQGTNGIMFLPQKPYFTNGTLREQIMYPKPLNSSKDLCDIVPLLEYVDMMNVFDRVGGLDMQDDINWFDLLSPGEMQRLSFVRLFVHRPRFAVLDEATSQIGVKAEEMMYTKCQDLGITLISIGHRDSLKKFHQKELYLDGNSGWKIIQL